MIPLKYIQKQNKCTYVFMMVCSKFKVAEVFYGNCLEYQLKNGISLCKYCTRNVKYVNECHSTIETSNVCIHLCFAATGRKPNHELRLPNMCVWMYAPL